MEKDEFWPKPDSELTHLQKYVRYYSSKSPQDIL